MTTIFRKQVDEDGNETYVEVDPREVELPEDHPLYEKYKRATAESIERRKALKQLKEQNRELLASLEPDDDNEDTPDEPKQTPTVDPKEIARLALEEFRAEQAREAEQKTTRQKTIDQIMKDTGLSETFRPVLERIPDQAGMMETASHLAKELNAFENAPSNGNGEQGLDDLFSKADTLLEMDDDD